MFSGIVVEVGEIVHAGADRVSVRCAAATGRTTIGGSIAVNGVCLTATRVDDAGFDADVMPETLRRTNLGALRTGSPVNLELALSFGGEVGGHLVQGHVDGVGRVTEMREEGNAVWMTLEVPVEVLGHCVLKGGIAIDGVSLTIARISGSTLSASLIPHTLASTIANAYRVGTEVNLEADLLGKYVASYLERTGIMRIPPDPGQTGPGQ